MRVGIRFLILFTGAIAVGAEPLGGIRSSEIEPGLNKLVSNYASCATTLDSVGAAMAAAQLPIPPRLAEGSLHRIRLDATFGARKETLAITLLKGTRIHDHPLVDIPPQSFLLGSRETLHKMIQDLARLGGFYLAVRAPTGAGSKEMELSAFLAERFAPVEIAGKPGAIAAGRYHLVPIHQLKPFLDLVAGRAADWGYTASEAPAQPEPFYVPSRTTPGVVVTGRGTFYVFRENGAVDVYARDGRILSSSAPVDDELPYASHAAILRRQGVRVATRDPVACLEAGLAANAPAIEAHQQANGTAPSAWGTYGTRMEGLHRRFQDATGRWSESEKGRILGEALALASTASAMLPDRLRPRDPAGPEVDSAPTTEGRRELRVLRRFFVVRNPAGLESYPFGLRVFLTHDDCMHLQAAHAVLGGLALTAEKESLIAGGVLSYTYDTDSRRLKAIGLEGNGMVSLADRSAMRELRPEELPVMRKLLLAAFAARGVTTVSVLEPR